MEIRRIEAPLSRGDARLLRCGEAVLLSGVIYTARDAAHQRLMELTIQGEALPITIKDAILYYVGPTPAVPGHVIGSAGPTTAYRMDSYTPELIRLGMTGMIGKGKRSPEVITAMREYGAVYFGAIGGAGALLARCVESSEVIAYEDLGAEAIRKLTVRDMPLTVVVDHEGNDLYEQGRMEYLQHSSFIINHKSSMRG
jgi:fumarate hydratase subunit beta